MTGVQQIRHAADLLGGVLPGFAGRGPGVDHQARIAVTDTDHRHRVLVLGQDQLLPLGQTHPEFVVHGRPADQGEQLAVGLGRHLVDGDELFVQVVEGGTRRFQPVLEHRDVPGVRVVPVQPVHGTDGEGDELFVLLRGQRAGGGVLGIVGGAVDQVPAGHHDVVTAAEEALRAPGHLVEVHVLGHPAVPAGGGDPGTHQCPHMLQPGLGGQVVPLVRHGPLRHAVTVVGLPVVQGDDLEEVAEQPELGGGVVEVLWRHLVDHPPTGVVVDHPGLLRGGLAQSGDAEGAVGLRGPRDHGMYPGRGHVHRAVAASRDGPDLGTGERVDLFDGAVGHPAQGSDPGALGQRGPPCGRRTGRPAVGGPGGPEGRAPCTRLGRVDRPGVHPGCPMAEIILTDRNGRPT